MSRASVSTLLIAGLAPHAAGCAAAWGPLAPRTALGRALALALVVLVGALVVGPVAIVVAEVRRAARPAPAAWACAACGARAHRGEAAYCRHCGTPLSLGSGPDAP